MGHCPDGRRQDSSTERPQQCLCGPIVGVPVPQAVEAELIHGGECREEQLDSRVQAKSADVPVPHRTSENAIGQGAEVTVLQMLEEIVDVAYSVFEERIRRRIVEQISIVTSQQTTEVVT